MQKKKMCQGIDGVNLKTNLNMGKTLFAPYEEKFNKGGKKVFTIEISHGVLITYCNLPRLIRKDNIRPFGISDYEKIDYVKNYIIDNTRCYLEKHLKTTNVDELLKNLTVSSLECNLTSTCVGECTPSDVIKLINISRAHYKKDTVLYQKPKDNSKFEKYNTTLNHERVNQYKLKIYDKTIQMQREQCFDIEPNTLRIEFIYMKRLLLKLFGNDLTINNVFSTNGFNKILNEYTFIFENDIIIDIKKCLTEISNNICNYMINCHETKYIEKAVFIFKEQILDVVILQRALEKYNKKLHNDTDNSRQSAYTYKKKTEIPKDVNKTIKKFHKLCTKM